MMNSIVESNVTPMETEEGIVRLVVSISQIVTIQLFYQTRKINAQVVL